MNLLHVNMHHERFIVVRSKLTNRFSFDNDRGIGRGTATDDTVDDAGDAIATDFLLLDDRAYNVPSTPANTTAPPTTAAVVIVVFDDDIAAIFDASLYVMNLSPSRRS